MIFLLRHMCFWTQSMFRCDLKMSSLKLHVNVKLSVRIWLPVDGFWLNCNLVIQKYLDPFVKRQCGEKPVINNQRVSKASLYIYVSRYATCGFHADDMIVSAVATLGYHPPIVVSNAARIFPIIWFSVPPVHPAKYLTKYDRSCNP